MPTPVNLPGVFGLPPDSPVRLWLENAQQKINVLGQLWAYEIVAPVTGFAHQIPVRTGVCLLTPAGVLASGTLTLPGQAADGFRQSILTSQTVTALTISPATGQTIVGTASLTLTAGVQIVYMFVASNNTWYKMN